jgi:hypothetical protein
MGLTENFPRLTQRDFEQNNPKQDKAYQEGEQAFHRKEAPGFLEWALRKHRFTLLVLRPFGPFDRLRAFGFPGSLRVSTKCRQAPGYPGCFAEAVRALSAFEKQGTFASSSHITD